MEKSFPNTYCYDRAVEGITGKVNGEWSPNNLRRLIISPDGLILQFHIRPDKIIMFENKKAMECFLTPDYKPVVSSLVKYVCSCIEEIVYCTKSKNSLYLPQSELALTSLIADNKAKNTEDALRKNILSRFVRLRGLVFSSMDIGEFYSSYGALMKDKKYHLSDDKNAKGLRIVDFHTTDWYERTALRPQFYAMDIAEGNLKKHFDKIKNNILTDIENRKKDAFKESTSKVSSTTAVAYKSRLDMLSSTLDITLAFTNVIGRVPMTDIFSNIINESSIREKFYIRKSFTIGENITLPPDVISKLAIFGILIKKEHFSNIEEETQVTTSSLLGLTLDFYHTWASLWVFVTMNFMREYPTTLKISCMNTAWLLVSSPTLEENKETIASFVGASFKISQSSTCICTSMCKYIVVLINLLLSNTDYKSKDIGKEEFWLNLIKRGDNR